MHGLQTIRTNPSPTGRKLSFQEDEVLGYHDMKDDDTPRWMLYAALVGAGFVAGMLVAQIIAVLQ